MKFKIITDSTADINPEILEKYDITVASLDVIMDGKPHRAVDVPNEVFYAHLNDCLTNGKKLPSTSQVTPFAFEKVLEPYANLEDTFVLVLTIGKELSNTYYSAQKAIENLEMKNVHLFDTYIVTFGLGALVTEIAKICETPGITVEEVIERGEDLNSRVWMYFAIDDLRCLRAGGRLSEESMKQGMMARLKPIAYICKKVEICGKAMGQGMATKWIAERVVAERDPEMPLYFGQAMVNEPIERYKSQYGKQLALTGEELNYTMGPIVATHTGAGCAGIAFFKKK
jgi:DegV family protein with EDD domain